MTGSKSFCLALLLTVLPAAAWAAPDAPRAEAQTFQFSLTSGMQVLVIPDHRAPVVTQMVWFKVGGVDDPPGISGLAHFFEHMMFRGTKAVPGDLYAQTIAKNGGEENAFTTHDYTAFYERDCDFDRLKLAMDLEADRLVNLDLSDNNVTTEREVVAGRAPHAGGQQSAGADQRSRWKRRCTLSTSLWPAGAGLAGRGAPYR